MMALALMGAFPAAADPEDSGPQYSPDTSLTAVLGATGTSTTVVLPTGTDANSLSATLTLEDTYDGAYVRVLAGGVTVATLDASQAGPVQVDIPALPQQATTQSTDGQTTLEIGLVYNVDATMEDVTDLGCRLLPPDLEATLSDITVGLDDAASAVTTVADFMSGPAEQILVVSSSSTDDERAAALAAVASSARAWSDAEVEIVTSAPTGLAPAYPGAIRIIEIQAGEGASTQTVTSRADGVPVLTLAGNDTASAAAALADARIGLADSDETTSLENTVAAEDAGTLSLSDLGTTSVRLSGIGTSEVYVGVNQSAFGGPVKDLTIHLEGVHTALPEQIVATVSVYWNDNLVDSFLMNEDTDVSRDISIPSTRIQASNAMRISMTASTASTTVCADDLSKLPVELDLDTNASVLTASPGQSLDPGFGRFPQAFGSLVAIAFDDALASDSALQLAGQIVAALQHQQSSAMQIDIVSVADALQADSPVLIVGSTAQTANSLSAPLRLASYRLVGADSNSLGVGVDQPYVALEAFESGGRDVLLAGGWAPDGQDLSELATSLGNWIADAQYGWLALNDDLLIAGPHGVQSMDSGAVVPQTDAIAAYDPVAWWTLGGALLVIVLLVGGAVLRRRRDKRRAARYVATEEAEAARSGRHAGRAGTR